MKSNSKMDGGSRVLIIPTGGTIGANGYDCPRKPPIIVETLHDRESSNMMQGVIERSGVDFFDWEKHGKGKILVKDSKLFDKEDMLTLFDIINESKDYNHFVITHGTDRMAENAALFKKIFDKNGSDKNAVTAFTGSMVPLSMHGKSDEAGQSVVSDGIAALLYATSNIDSKESGVYLVARHTHTRRLDFHNPENLQKDWLTSREDLSYTVHER